ADHVAKHGDGVKAIALKVKDATSAWEETTSRGGKSFLEPMTLTDGDGQLIMSGIHTYGDTVHLFIEREDYSGIFMPGFEKWESNYNPSETGLLYCDHCVGNVGWNQMNPWVKFYEDVMGFRNILTFDDKDISTEYSALMSKVMSNGNGFVKFPINEPAEGKKKSQVEEYLEFYNGEGVQHIAMATKNIVKTVTELQKRGVQFLNIPSTYYDTLPDRVGHIDEDLEPLKRLGILVDRDNEGYLLQIFSKPVEDRPRCSSKSSSAKARRVSAKEISKHYSKRSRKSRSAAGICKEEDRQCRITKDLARCRGSITSGFIATGKGRVTRTKGSITNTWSRPKVSTKPTRSCITCGLRRGCAA